MSEAWSREVLSAPVLAVSHAHLVEETFFGRGTDAEVAAVMPLCRFAEDVSRRMPEHALALVRLKVEELEVAVPFERSFEIPENRRRFPLWSDLRPVGSWRRTRVRRGGLAHPSNDDALGKALAQLLGDVHRAGLPARPVFDASVRQLNLDRLLRLCLNLLILHRLESVPELETMVKVARAR